MTALPTTRACAADRHDRFSTVDERMARGAVADFAESYADQTERDYDRFVQALEAGRLEARMGV